MTRTATFEITGGVRVVVPDHFDAITPYILYEQHDWFEDEIGFLRKLIRRGNEAIDVGANYGVYTLSMAKAVGPEGKVWAFEPASSTAAFLAQGVAANGFEHVVLESCALSSQRGSAQLSLNDSSELNSLMRSGQAETASEIVRMETLDNCMRQYAWKNIGFLKIDAEGEEINIVKGGREFLSAMSPLILYEVKAAEDLHFDLVSAFAEQGYDSYRLVPGLDLLVPFDSTVKPDDYLLNLFCCKADRAEELASQGFLVRSGEIDAVSNERQRELQELYGQTHGWQKTLTMLPYGAALAERWSADARNGQNEILNHTLTWYAMSHDRGLAPIDRFLALRHCYQTMNTLCGGRPAGLRNVSLARIAREYGARAVAVNALSSLIARISSDQSLDLDEVFLAPGERFDTVSPGENLFNWALAGILEELERASAYSSFFLGASARTRLEVISSLGFASAEMGRRLELVRLRFPDS